MESLRPIVGAFVPTEIVQAGPLGSGHIHDTYLVESLGTAPDYILQRINTAVFERVDEMMENIQLVCQHLARSGPEDSALILIPTQTGTSYFRDEADNCWRMYRYWPHLQAFDQARSLADIHAGAAAFGHFLRRMNDFPADRLHITLKDFHHVPVRIRQLGDALQHGRPDRITETKALWKLALNLAEDMTEIQRIGDQQAFPLRCTHNDTKFNNVLLDQAGKGRCVIDLDTVMPGWVHMDLGDGIRTTACPVPEDHPSPAEMIADMNRVSAFLEGYLGACGPYLTDVERQFLPQAPAMLAYLMGIRFLADYLLGDPYYKIGHAQHNLQRAAAQLALAIDLKARKEDMQALVQRF